MKDGVYRRKCDIELIGDMFQFTDNPRNLRIHLLDDPSYTLVEISKDSFGIVNWGSWSESTPKRARLTFGNERKAEVFMDLFLVKLDGQEPAKEDAKEEECPECWGTGYWRGYGVFCSKGCKG